MEKIKGRLIELNILLLTIILPVIFLTVTKDVFLIKKTIFITVILFTLILIIIKKSKMSGAKLLAPIATFIIAISLSLINSKNIDISLYALVEKLVFISVYFIAATQLERKFRPKIVDGVLFSGFIVCLYGLLQYFRLDFIVWATSFEGRISSSLGNPNFLAGYLVAVLPLAVVSFINENKMLKKLLLALNVILLITCLILTQTRGSWIAFAGSILVLIILAGIAYWNDPGRRIMLKKFYAVTAIIIIIASGYIISVNNAYTRKFKTIFRPNIASVYERVFKWRTAQEMITDHPVLGVGIGAIKVNYALYQIKAKQKMRIILRGTSESQVHNEYLQILAEAGFVGLASFLCIIIVFFINAFRQLREKNLDSKWISIGIIAGVAGILIDSISNFPLHIIPTGFLFWLYLGMIEKGNNACEKAVIEKKAVFTGGPLIRIILVIIIIMSWIRTAAMEFVADAHRATGDSAFAAGDWQKTISEHSTAHKLNPVDGQACYVLGMAFVNMKDFDSAIRAFKESIKIRNYGEVYNDLANCYYMKGMKDEAIRNWEIALKLELPNSDDQDKVRNNLKILKDGR